MYIYIYIYLYVVFTTEGFFEVAIESCPIIQVQSYVKSNKILPVM